MRKFFSDLSSYLRAVFVDGIQRVFTVFDVLGLLMYFSPVLGKMLTLDFLLTRRIGITIILASFISANFTLYTKYVKHRAFTFEIIKVEQVQRVGDWLEFGPRSVGVAEKIEIALVVRTNISNSGPMTSVSFFVDSLDPFCLTNNTSCQDINVTLRHQTASNQRAVELDNPYHMQSDEMKTIQLIVKIAFDTLCVEKTLGCLSTFTTVNVRLGAKPTGLNPSYQSILCDLSPIHHEIEEQVSSKIQHLQSTNLSGVQVFDTIKRYLGKTI